MEIKTPRIRAMSQDFVVFNFEGPVATPEGLQKLREILDRHPGRSEVYLAAPQSAKQFRLGSDIRIDIESAAGELLTVFGGNIFKTDVPSKGGLASP